MLENIIQDILTAKNNGAYISALALALTLPNILSNIEKGKNAEKTEYIKWFDDWVYNKYFKSKENDELENPSREIMEFNGIKCYQLRCALLHSGNVDLIDRNGNRTVDVFELCTSDTRNHATVCGRTANGPKNLYMSVNIVYLIDTILLGVEDYISKNEELISNHKNSDFYLRTFGGIQIEKR